MVEDNIPNYKIRIDSKIDCEIIKITKKDDPLIFYKI